MSISEKISSVLENLDDKQRYGIFAGILLFVFLLNFFVLMQPQLTSLSKISPEIKTLKTDVKTATDNIARTSHYRGEVDRLRDGFERINFKIKKKEELPIILEKISVIADNNSIKLDHISPNSQDEEIILENNQRTYYHLPISIKARGAYHNFGKFLNDIENEDSFIGIGTFSITKSTDTRKHAIVMVLKAMVYEEVEQ
jgi:Tfp pilus assembly protein PilO